MVKNLTAMQETEVKKKKVPGSRRFPGEGNGQPTPVLLLGKSHKQRSLVGLWFIELQRVGHN